MSIVLYLSAAEEAYTLARGEHSAHLRAESFPAWEPGGVHGFSRAVGEMEAARAEARVEDPYLWNAAESELHIDRFSIRAAAREDAVADFERERFEEWRMRMRVERAVV